MYIVILYYIVVYMGRGIYGIRVYDLLIFW